MTIRTVMVICAALVGGFEAAPVVPSTPGPPALAWHQGSPVQLAAGTDPSVVPQTHSRPGGAGYNILGASQFHPAAASTGGRFFRGGRASIAPPATSATPPRPGSATPKISVAGGLNQPGLPATGFGNTPPDSTGAIGPANYVEMVNSRIAVYDRSLNPVSSITIQSFVGQQPTVPYCDPQVQWDPAANRWLFSFLYCNTSSSQQLLFFGWSKTSDPTDLTFNFGTMLSNAWCQFAFDNSPYLLDYPKLGHNGNFLIVGGNLYDETRPNPNPPFVSAGIEWAALPANGDASCAPPTSTGANLIPLTNGDGSTFTFTPVPVNTMSTASDGYILSAYDPAGNVGPAAPQSKVSVWHLDAAGVLHADSDVTVNTYNTPASARQLGSTNLIDTLDGRLTQAVGNQGTGFYTQHTVAGAGGLSKVDWYEFAVTGSTVVLVQQGSVTSLTDWVFDAAISPRFDGQGAAIVYNRSSVNIDPLIAARIRYAGTAAGQMAPGELVLATSSAADTDFSCNNPLPGVPCRWGDYAGASPDPLKTTLVWGTAEFNAAVGPAPAWSDENFAIMPDRDPMTQSGPATPSSRAGVNQSAPNPPSPGR